MTENEMDELSRLIYMVLKQPDSNSVKKQVIESVQALSAQFPLYETQF